MDNVTENEKRTIGQKFLEFKRVGMISYGKYLVDQLEYSSKSKIRTAYVNYIKDQIEMNNRGIDEVDKKLNSKH